MMWWKIFKIAMLCFGGLAVLGMYLFLVGMRTEGGMDGEIHIMGWCEWWRRWRSGQWNSPWHVKQPDEK